MWVVVAHPHENMVDFIVIARCTSERVAQAAQQGIKQFYNSTGEMWREPAVVDLCDGLTVAP